MSDRDPHGVACPTCQAPAGAPCDVPREIHWERRLAMAWIVYPDPWLIEGDDGP